MKLAEYVKKNANSWGGKAASRPPRPVSSGAQMILDFIRTERPESSLEVAEALGLNLRTAQNMMNRMKKKGMIRVVKKWETCESDSQATPKANNNIGR